MKSNSHTKNTFLTPHHFFFAVGALLLVLTTALTGHSQLFQPDRGLKLGNNYQVGEFDTINTTNGNLMINLPLAMLPPGRGSASAGVYLIYNSKLYNMRNESRPHPTRQDASYSRTVIEPDLNKGGWTIGSGYRLEFETRFGNHEPPCTSGPSETNMQIVYSNKLRVVFPDGSSHEMIPLGHKDKLGDRYFNISIDGMTRSCTGVPVYTTPPVYYSLDGTFLRLEPGPNSSWTLYFPDGSKVENGTRVYDRNGNNVVSGYGASDQFGRAINIAWANATDQLITSKGFQGEDIVWRIRWKNINVNKTYAACGPDPSCPSIEFPVPTHRDNLATVFRVVDKVFQPAELGGGVYTFTYNGSDVATGQSNGWGELSGVELPSGAKLSYGYTMDGRDGPTIFEETKEIIQNRVTTKTLRYSLEYEDTAGEEAVEVWRYDIGPEESWVTAPDGSVTGSEYGITDPGGNSSPSWDTGLTLATYSADGTKTESLWQRNIPTPCTEATTCASYYPYQHADNPYVKTTFTSLKDAGGNYTLTAIKDFSYDKNGNVTEVRHYDYVPYNSVPRTNGRPAGLPENAEAYLKRITATQFHNATPDASGTDYLDPDAYHRPTSKRLLRLAHAASVMSADRVPKSRVETMYDHTNFDSGNTVSGNPVITRAWDSTRSGASAPLTDANSVTTRAAYNGYGMPISSTDANGVTTLTTYGSIAAPNGAVSDLYPTMTVTAANTQVARRSAASYDFYSGLATSHSDIDNSVTSTTLYDGAGRPVLVKNAVGTPAESWLRTEYHDQGRYVVVRSDLQTAGDGKKVATQFFDPLGRTRLSKVLEDAGTQSATNETDGIKVQMRYRSTYAAPAGFTYQLTSNPYRAASLAEAASDEMMGWTRNRAWNTGRRQDVETFSGAELPAPWGNNVASTGAVTSEVDAHVVTTTDQAGKQRRSLTDALGQLARIDEPDPNGTLGSINAPAQPTFYQYSTVGHMVHVQQGVQNRHFMYDSIGRLIRVRQPEQDVNSVLTTAGNPANNSWTAGFEHDGNGNVLKSRDAKNVTVTYAYDGLNRPVQRAYSDQTPAVTYAYDEIDVPFSKGRLTKISSSVSEMRYRGYDAAGRMTAAEQMTDGRSYPTLFQYDLAGNLTEQTYPSGRVLKNFLESDGEIASIASRSSNGPFRNYASELSYTPSGAIKHLQLGNGLWESARLNPRGQVTEISLGNSPTDGQHWRLNHQYGELDANGSLDPSRNTGDVARQTISFAGLPAAFVQTFRYDSLYRIREAGEINNSVQTWRQTFGYDRYGNRTAFSSTVGDSVPPNNPAPPQIDPQTNRFLSGQGYSYDLAGNLTRDPQQREFVFNGDNKQVEVRDGDGNVIARYVYDGTGKRIKKIIGAETTVFVYDGFGKLVAEMSTRPAAANPTVNYTATDTLGSPRVISNSRGQIVSRRDFLPFGEEVASDPTYRSPGRSYGINDAVRQKFTGYQRDEETGLDFAEARMYDSRNGRFTAVDPLLASGKSSDPQTFNRYAYTLNRPLVLTDPTGLQVATKPEKKATQTSIVVNATWLVQNSHGEAEVPSEVKANLDKAASTMASNIYNAMSAVHSINENSVESSAVTLDGTLSVKGGAPSTKKGAAARSGAESTVELSLTSTTVYASPDPILRELRTENDAIRSGVVADISDKKVPVPVANGPPTMQPAGEVLGGKSPTLAASFSQAVSKVANQIAKETYEKTFSDRGGVPRQFAREDY